MSEIVEKFKYLIEKAEYFQKLKENENFLFEELIKVPKSDIKKIKSFYETGKEVEKIKKIRVKICDLLINNDFNIKKFHNVKNEINAQYKTNILQAWKDYSILYVFFFNPIKEEVNKYLKEIGNYLIEQAYVPLKLKTTNFDGAQNFGEVGCWLALYNPKYKSQQEGIQYFINFFYKNTTYGTLKYQGKKDIKRYKYNKESLNKNLIQTIVEDIKSQVNIILEKQNKDGDKMQSDNKQTQPLNQILYGPPGTGKTYHTINKALGIILEKQSNDEIKQLLSKNTYSKEERKKLQDEFEKYKEQGQIEFVTFHQSYGYEEFVEGIKAKTITDEETKKKTITYDIEAGIFKQICEKAKTIQPEKSSVYDFDESINIWKISLGDSQNSEEEYLFDYSIKENKILLGFGDGLDFSKCRNRNEIAKKLGDDEKYSFPPTAVNTLKNKMKKDDIVLVSYGNRKLRAIAKITGDYEHLDDDNLKNYVQSRNVEWLLIPNEPFSYEKILKKQFSQMSIYDIKNNVKIEDLRNLLKQTNITNTENKNYVLIIDEINRGNISKIFGELITLIEESKRIGKDEALHVKLPYSGDSEEPFGIPSNLYIIGTMNTADRSIAPIDTALRRRFVFEEMGPKPALLEKIVVKDGDTNTEIKLDKLLDAINTRIEYLYDRDHTIGHSYLIDVETLGDLKFAFKNKIIPLLAEYFYEDWENVDLVLNQNDFIVDGLPKEDYLLQVKSKITNKKIYKVSDEKDWEIDNFKKIYDDSIDLAKKQITKVEENSDNELS